MATHRMPADDVATDGAERPAPGSAVWILPSAVVCVAALLLAALLPGALVLPAMSIVLAATGFALAAGLYLTGHRMGRNGTPGWDMAAALVFFGFAAALLTNTGEALAALGELRTR
jgi:hypothetical protein